MANVVIMPKAGMAMEEGTVIKWYKAEGDAVKKGEALLEIETDKTNMEVESDFDGTLLKIVHQEGDVVPVVQPIAYIGAPGEAIPQETAAPAKTESAQPAPKAEKAQAEFDVIVVGGGPAGYTAAIKAAQLGGKVALVEQDTVGGTCLNRGCIPTKTYLKSAEYIENLRQFAARGIELASTQVKIDPVKAVAKKNMVVRKLTGGVASLLKSNGVAVYAGKGIIGADQTVAIGQETIKGDRIIFAGGSRADRIPIPGMESQFVVTSDELLDFKAVPQKLAIIGGGVIGVEMASVFAAFGSQVHIVELMDRILPNLDEEVSKFVRRMLEKKGIRIETGTKLEKIEETQNGVRLILDGAKPVEADLALLSIGRKPDLSGVEGLDVALDRGRVKVNEAMQTSIPWLYAPGDINGRLMLAHAAFHMAEIAAENAMGGNAKVDLSCVPSCVYTNPEVGAVGLTEAKARESYDVCIGKFPFSANGRALASDEAEGFVKIVADAKYGQILGVHIVGPGAAEMINEAAALMAMEITVEEVATIIHGHPTFSEAFMEAAADCMGRSIHLPKKN